MNIPFSSDEHKRFFYGCLKKAQNYDEYRQALFYTMGISEITRDTLPQWFDFFRRLHQNRMPRSGLADRWHPTVDPARIQPLEWL